MKKSIIIMIVSASVLLSGCGSEDDNGANITGTGTETAVTTAAHDHSVSTGNLEVDGDTYRVTEENYINGISEIYTYYEDFVGKRIELEGEYIAEMYNSEMYYTVYRMVREHCHEDHDHSMDARERLGFRINYEGDKPTDKSFVRVSGILDTYEENGNTYLIINADILKKCETPGKVDLN